MNAHGQRFVDAFDTPELQPFYPVFLEGANIIHAHTLLQVHAGMGYLSEWACSHFDSVADKNTFFAALGERYITGKESAFSGVNPARTPDELAVALGMHWER